MGLISIDGYDLDDYCIVDGINETFSLLEGISSARTQSNKMWYDITGTERTYTITIRRDETISAENWSFLWSIFTSPTAYHSVTVPDGANGTLTFNAHIVSGARSLDFIDSNGKYHWSDYDISFVPESPQLTA